ncbi:KamA family radical SAM protein [Patescibacteria group bacterium]|nr:KamA family radical SAM protein [Patescibacteria group bacterium]
MELWQQELTQCVRTIDQLERYLPIANREALKQVIKNMRLAITPHTLKLIDFTDPMDPIFLMTVPQEAELRITPEELVDPIGDESKSPVPFLTHRYPDRVLVYASFSCSAYCRFCFRRFKTGQATPGPSESDVDRICLYLQSHPEVDEVILTGGDPLTLMDGQLELLLKKLRAVPSIIRIRIHTRVPVNLPVRITPELVKLFRRYMDELHPIFVVTHFNHPRELAKENIQALARLIDAGIVVRNQSVLLRGVNDSVKVLRALFKSLTNIRVLPYYLHQLDLARGTGHFRVPLEQGIELMRELQGSITGIALPKYMLDIPGGKGKTPLQHQYLTKSGMQAYQVENYLGEIFSYSEPETSACAQLA